MKLFQHVPGLPLMESSTVQRSGIPAKRWIPAGDGIPADSSTFHRSRWNRWNSSLPVPACPLLESTTFQYAGIPERRLLFQLTMYSSIFQQFAVEFRQVSCGSIAPACLQALQKCGSCALIDLQRLHACGRVARTKYGSRMSNLIFNRLAVADPV